MLPLNYHPNNFENLYERLLLDLDCFIFCYLYTYYKPNLILLYPPPPLRSNLKGYGLFFISRICVFKVIIL